MASVAIDGMATRYEIIGAGAAAADVRAGRVRRGDPNGRRRASTPRSSCSTTGRRNSTGANAAAGGRIERITWTHQAAQGNGLLDPLGIARAHIMGGCPVAAFAVMCPQMFASMVLFWRLGGAKSSAAISGLPSILPSCSATGSPPWSKWSGKRARRSAPRRGGPWAAVLKHDRGFADAYAVLDVHGAHPVRARHGARRRLGGPHAARNPVPGGSRARRRACTSAARYLGGCLPRAECWDVPVADQTEAATPGRIAEFLDKTAVD